MKVSRLIEILKLMPPDADIATHANNHTYESLQDKICPICQVALVKGGETDFGEKSVLIGNWDEDDIDTRWGDQILSKIYR